MKTLRLLRALLIVSSMAIGCASQAAPALVAGDLPPNQLGKTLDGERVDLGNFAGKALVISFWATWCPQCMQELPILQGIQKNAGKDNLQVIAVNTESRDVFRRVARALSDLDMVMAHDSDKSGSKAFGVNGIPHLVIVGRNGKIVSVFRGYDEKSLDRIVVDINRALAAQK